MSVEAIAWALNHAPVQSPVSKLVLIALANHARPDGSSAFPSVSTICRYTCLSERSVRQHLDNLEKQGVIRRCDQRIVAAYIDRTDRRPVGYDIVMNGVQEMQVAQPRGAGGAVNGVQEIPERGAGDAPKPYIKPSNETHEIFLQIFVNALHEFLPQEVTKPKATTSWSASLQRIEQSGVSPERFKQIVDWALQDQFWRRNIVSPMKLEKHWDRLLLEMSSGQSTVRPTRVESRLEDAMTMVQNLVRLKKPAEDILSYIHGQPEHLHSPLERRYAELASAG